MTKRILGIYLRTKILKAQRRVRAANAQFTAAYNEDIQGAKTTKTLLQKKALLSTLFDAVPARRRRHTAERKNVIAPCESGYLCIPRCAVLLFMNLYATVKFFTHRSFFN
ncbi:hypothetical protein ABK01_03225 [Treponema sp. OMZ 305]|uniref:hypothetical protein n=1 Tax=Treponema sp. OMZ 305 TaxID=1659192 RepID=UPI0020A52B04|nr:hypothetical protein [Treponema sp. OMZ 305]UTC56804.1 hypothetical protein ABK01_03225 [Treponema sp. OMZ 305]